MSYDSESYNLAAHFLPDGIDESIIRELAEDIQYNIELFIGYSEHAKVIAEARSCT